MSYQLYRSMSLGESLQAALDDLIEKQLITPELALKASISKCPHRDHDSVYVCVCMYVGSTTI